MKLKEIFQKQGGMNLVKQYARAGTLGTAIGEYILLGKSRTALEILCLSTQLKTKQKLAKKYSKNLTNNMTPYYPICQVIKYGFAGFKGWKMRRNLFRSVMSL